MLALLSWFCFVSSAILALLSCSERRAANRGARLEREKRREREERAGEAMSRRDVLDIELAID
jgi:hypothetical protein